jgi:gamma-glutamylcyclotransferase (GGCT)/AIG2-like uncharacterized protein YtfP
MYIFVYGTLRRGGGLNFKIQDLKEPIGKFNTVPKYTLWDMGCPCLAHGGETSVVGEVYKINDLSEIANIHNMEVRAGYTLERVELLGFPDEAYAYFQTPEPGWWINPIESGDWIQYKSSLYAEDQART